MKKNNKRVLQNESGFTLIEIIAVLVILGILAAVAVSRMNFNNADLSAMEASLKSHLRYSQSKAMHSDTMVWGTRINSSTDRYWLFYSPYEVSCAWADNRVLPPGADASDVLDTKDRIRTSKVSVDISGILIGTSSTNRLTLVFDEMGVPFTAVTNTLTFKYPISLTKDNLNLTRLSSDLKITLSDGSGNTRIITISSETGFVQ